jgi:hypothetical protein
MRDYIITFAIPGGGTLSYVMTGYLSKESAIADAAYFARIESGPGVRMKQARLYKGAGDQYVCQGA